MARPASTSDVEYIEFQPDNGEATYNALVRTMDIVLQAVALDKDLTAPPSDPEDGDCYIVAATATGDWAGKDLHLAQWFADTGTWEFAAPVKGYLVRVLDEGLWYTYKAAGWTNEPT